MKTLPNQILFAQAEAVLRAGKRIQIRVVGRSMEPFLLDNEDVVIIKPCVSTTLRRGDIVLFKVGISYCLHRIIRIKDREITLCGDGIYQSVEHISADSILGVLHSVVRPSGRTVVCSSIMWKACGNVWMALRPVRRYLLYIRHKWHRLNKANQA